VDVNELTLTPSPRKWLLLLVGSLVFFAGGVLNLDRGPVVRVVGWSTVVFFGLCAAVALLVLVPGSAYLRLTPHGFDQRTLFRTHRQSWQDVERFIAYASPPSRVRLVGFVLAPGVTVRDGEAREWARENLGVDGALPDTYGMSADELAALMNQWLERHKASP
jgi:hypothetical protein